jgi:hypothetical protein
VGGGRGGAQPPRHKRGPVRAQLPPLPHECLASIVHTHPPAVSASPDPLERAHLPARSAASPARNRPRVSTLRPAHPCTSSVSASRPLRTPRARPSPGASRDIPRQRPPPRAAVGIGSDRSYTGRALLFRGQPPTMIYWKYFTFFSLGSKIFWSPTVCLGAAPATYPC